MSNNSNNPDASPMPYYVARYQGRAVTIKRDPDYQATIKLMQSSIVKLRSLDPQNIIILTRLAEYGDALVQVSKETWADVLSSVKLVEIMNELDDSEEQQIDRDSAADRSQVVSAGCCYPISITLRTTYHELIVLDNIPGSATVREMKGIIHTRESQWTCSAVSVPKFNIHFSVNRKWELSLRQPSDKFPKNPIQSAAWTISTPTTNTVLDSCSNSELRWILWDGSPSILYPSQNASASTEPTVQLSPGTESYESILTLEFNNSVAVPFGDIERYVNQVFQSLGLHADDFISDFLSQVQSAPCSHLAIRFLPQSDYQKVALLSIPEQPSARVVHVVLLYKRLNPKSIPLWNSALPVRSDDAQAWKKVVDPQNIVGGSAGRSVMVVVDFTFLEIP
ncbi:polyubiquitin-C [Ceratobasidium sp. AG-Ba]|nr:polyubiquitin-C [Ceratobasidium sp. AG-Ba]